MKRKTNDKEMVLCNGILPLRCISIDYRILQFNHRVNNHHHSQIYDVNAIVIKSHIQQTIIVGRLLARRLANRLTF